jgi:group I intron endonuclease
MKIVGIYKITSPSNKVYIGQSWNIKKRFTDYNGTYCKGQKKLWASFQKYSKNKHSFEIVHQLPFDISQEQLTIYEQLYMDSYKAVGIELMNLKDAGAYGKHTAETKEKIRIAASNFKHSPATLLKMRKPKSKEHARKIGESRIKKIQQFTKSGEFIKEFNSIKEASKIAVQASCCARGRQKTAGGFIWKYV